MKTTPALQDIISYLMEKHERSFYPTFTYKRLRLFVDEPTDFPILCIRVYPHAVRVAHEVDSDRDITDPDITFSTVGKEWIPVWRTTKHLLSRGVVGTIDHPYAFTITKSLTAWRQGVPFEFEPIPGREEEQAELARFCEEWAQKLEQEGWRERAMRA